MKRRFKLAAALLIIAAIFFQYRPAAAIRYSDVKPGDWYYGAVNTLSNLGIINGFPEGDFQPNGTLTVGQFLKLVGVAMYPRDVPEVKDGMIRYDEYTQFPAPNWASPYYYAALFKGIVTRDEFPADCLNNVISRYQMTMVLYNLEKNIFGMTYTPAPGLEDYILDYYSIPDKYLTYVRSSYAAGLLQGDDTQCFNGGQSLTRAQGATVIMRLIYPATRLEANFWAKDTSNPYPTPNPDPVSDEWFSDAAIFGNSLVGGLEAYSGLCTPDYIFSNGISVFQVSDYDCYPYNGSRITLLEALALRSYKKIIIELGVNELGYKPSQFYAEYSTMITQMQKIQPNARIYIQTIVPVTKAKSNSGGTHTIEKIIAFNAELRKIADNLNCRLIDTYSFFADDEGYLPDEMSPNDGVHLLPEYYDDWVAFLKQAVA